MSDRTEFLVSTLYFDSNFILCPSLPLSLLFSSFILFSIFGEGEIEVLLSLSLPLQLTTLRLLLNNISEREEEVEVEAEEEEEEITR